jgi:hypothetical protein
VTENWRWFQLSERAQEFFRPFVSVDRLCAAHAIKSDELPSEAEWRLLASQVEELNERYAGACIPVLGGRLAGEMQMGRVPQLPRHGVVGPR